MRFTDFSAQLTFLIKTNSARSNITVLKVNIDSLNFRCKVFIEMYTFLQMSVNLNFDYLLMLNCEHFENSHFIFVTSNRTDSNASSRR